MDPQPHTRDQVLREAARLFAQRGFRGTSVEDIGAACGISGPAVYKHFTNKQALLSRLLIEISEALLQGGKDVTARGLAPRAAVTELVRAHTAFALSEPDLIRLQDRDFASLSPEAAGTVRRLQRGYVELWVSCLRELDPALGADAARTRAHAVFGLLNSTPHSARVPMVARGELEAMALRALRG